MGPYLFSLIYVRLRLLLRQRLGWISIAVGCGLVLLALITSRVSWVNPAKIFWDFALATSFILQISLTLYLGTQLYPDEKNRRTLHLILSSGVSRLSWLVGNGLGIWLGLCLMNLSWFVLSALVSYLQFSAWPSALALQAQLLLTAETLILIFFAILSSLLVRPLLALAGCFVTVAFLHSLSNLQRIFTDPQVGAFVEDRGISVVLMLAKLLPPLEWFDLKSLVGYKDSMPATFILAMLGFGALWAVVFASLSWLRFERMDL